MRTDKKVRKGHAKRSREYLRQLLGLGKKTIVCHEHGGLSANY
jgi:hypothetical protein